MGHDHHCDPNENVHLPPRTPDTCRFRVPDSLGRACCELVCAISESKTSDVGSVELATCAACCRMSEPTPRSPNPVVASLAHGAVARQIATSENPNQQVHAAERLTWIEQFLETTGSPIAVEDVLETGRGGR